MTPRPLVMLTRVSQALSLAGALVACIIMFAMTALILLEIFLRSFLGTSTHIVEEYVGYGVGGMVFLALAYCLERGQLIRVEILFGRLSARLAAWLEFAICVATFLVMVLLVAFFWFSVQRNYMNGTISMTPAATPLWIPEFVMLVGMAVFCFRLATYALSLLYGGELIKSAAEFE